MKCKKKCINESKVRTAKLLCPECTDWGVHNNMPPTNILVCIYPQHTKLNMDVLLEELRKYITNFDPKKIVVATTTPYNANHIRSAHMRNWNGRTTSQTKTRRMDPTQPTPAINPHTGEMVNVPSHKIIKESSDNAFYMMQTMCMGGRDVAVLFDQGADHHLIEGELAEYLHFKVLRENPTNVVLAGGGSVSTEYGGYGFSIGPDPDGNYYDLSSQGITKVTNSFPKFDLTAINTELQSCTDPAIRQIVDTLPRQIGGTRAHLLVGIKSLALQPRLIHVLPSGLGIFRSPFKDKYGSDICYGGTHSTFSQGDGIHNIQSSITAYFTKMDNEYQIAYYPALAKAMPQQLVEGNVIQTRKLTI